MIAFDANFLIALFDPNAGIPKAKNKSSLVENGPSRIAYLIEKVQKSRGKILIPTPALSEYLVKINDINGYSEILRQSSCFQIADFDQRAAIEVALMYKQAVVKGNKRGNSNATWAKVKFDRQIVAIAKVNSVEAIYTDDNDIGKLAKQFGIKAISLEELPENPADRQGKLEV